MVVNYMYALNKGVPDSDTGINQTAWSNRWQPTKAFVSVSVNPTLKNPGISGSDYSGTSANFCEIRKAPVNVGETTEPQISNALDITISGASVTGTGGDLVPPTEFPLPHNIIGGVLSGASNRLFDMEDGVAVSQMYTMGRVMHWCMPQTRNMVASATRADQVQEWKDLRADNPLVSAGFHFSPFLTTRGYREKTSDFRRYLYDYLQTY